MFRPLTLLSLVAAAGAGYYLYQVKQSVAQLDRELRDVRRQTETAMERTQVLRAEWAMLNEPDRLRQVVQRTLTLEPMTPGQFVRFSDLSRRTGAPQVFAGAPSLFAAPRAAEPDAVAVAAAPAAPAPAPPPPAAATAVASLVPSAQAAVPARPAAPPPAEPPRAAAAAPPQPPAPAAAPAAAPAEPSRVAVAAAARPASPRPAAARPAAEPRPAASPPVQQAAATALVRPAMHVQPVGLSSASVLGIGRSALPPPVPFGSAQAATPAR